MTSIPALLPLQRTFPTLMQRGPQLQHADQANEGRILWADPPASAGTSNPLQAEVSTDVLAEAGMQQAMEFVQIRAAHDGIVDDVIESVL